MIEIKHSNTLLDSPVYKYYTQGITEKIEYYVSIGHSQQLSESLQAHEEDISGIIWAEIDSIPKGFISYSLREVDKHVMIINLMQADSEEVFKKIYDYFEDFSRELDCIYINETVTMKDVNRVNELESVGFNKEFFIMFKKV